MQHWNLLGPGVKTPSVHCQGCGFHRWFGSYNPLCLLAWPKQTNKKKTKAALKTTAKEPGKR